MEVVARGKPSLDDIERLSLHHFKSSMNTVKAKLSLLLLLICVSFYILIDVMDLVDGQKTILNSVSLYLILGCVLFFFLFKKLVKKSAKKQFESNKSLNAEQVITISEDEVKVQTESSTTCYSMDKIYKIEKSSDTIYFYISNTQAIMLPSRYFDTIDEFRKVSKLGKK